MRVLCDADYIVYKSCAAAETEVDWGDDVIVVSSRFTDAYKMVKRELDKIADTFMMDVEMILFFSSANNFRKKIFADYKGHRNRKKPCGYKRVINALKDEYQVVLMDTLEADDSMGIWATLYDNCVIVSPDKDMRQIPGKLHNLEETVEITPEEGRRWHLIQTLAGDQTDGYSGVPGIGVKRAITLLEQEGYTWQTVVKAFANKDLGEDVALQNARLAKILQAEDYDFTRNEPILWRPTTDAGDGVDSGATVQDPSAVGPTE